MTTYINRGHTVVPVEIIRLNPGLMENLDLEQEPGRRGIPGYKTSQAAGVDLFACIDKPVTLRPGDKPVLIPSGIAIKIGSPEYAAFLFPRSGHGHKLGLVLGNSTGVIDADYEGEIKISAWNRNSPVKVSGNSNDGYAVEPNFEDVITIEPGMRIAQMVFMAIGHASFLEVAEFSSASERGAGGFGSTGS
jgi:dUTP pyrophosphatase